jgi:hypothetical protein
LTTEHQVHERPLRPRVELSRAGDVDDAGTRLPGNLRQVRVEDLEGDQPLRLPVRQHADQVLADVERADLDDGEPEPEGAEERDRIRRRIGEVEGEVVPGDKAVPGQGRGDLTRRLPEFGVRPALSVVHERRPRAPISDARLHEVGEPDVRDLDGPGNIRGIVGEPGGVARNGRFHRGHYSGLAPVGTRANCTPGL